MRISSLQKDHHPSEVPRCCPAQEKRWAGSHSDQQKQSATWPARSQGWLEAEGTVECGSLPSVEVPPQTQDVKLVS